MRLRKRYLVVCQGSDGTFGALGPVDKATADREAGAWRKSIGRAAVVKRTRRVRLIVRGGSGAALSGLLTEHEATP